MAGARTGGYFAGVTRNTVLLAFASLFADISSEMLYPVLPIFLTQTLKASGSVVGLVEGLAEATQNIVQGFSGSLSDRLQRRKPIALVGYALAAIAKPLIGVSTVWQGVLGGRFLDRLGTGVRSAPRDALIASSVDEENRGRAFGLEGAGDNAGAFLGPVLAVILLSALHVDIHLIFYIAVIPGLLALAMIALVREGRPARVAAKAKIGLARFPRPYWKYLAVTALFGVGNSSNAFLILQTKALGAVRASGVGWYSTTVGLSGLAASLAAGLLWDRVGHGAVFLFGAASALAGAIALLALVPAKPERPALAAA